MTLAEVRDILDARVILGAELDSIVVEIGCGADLMSDVLAFGKGGALMLTGLANEQVVRTAEMAEMAAICFVRGKQPTGGAIELAREHCLPLLATDLPMFESCGRLHRQGLKGCWENGA
jgi:predicted transcriptional regulator